ncbi:MAG: hypothetical protein ACREL5_13530 [Gemmatimonadales bacterium]
MIELGDIAVIGGGCYGHFYTRQLESARDKGAVRYRELVIVDRDVRCQVAGLPPSPVRRLAVAGWSDFLDEWLDPAARDRGGLRDMIVPSPFMPHLMAQWLMRRACERWPDRDIDMIPADAPVGTPFDRLHDDGTRYVSHADWLCPTHCVEPLLCPVIRAPRTWEMGETVAAWTTRRAATRPVAGPALFTCRHVVHGVGMYRARVAFEALAQLNAVAERAGGGDLVIGSVSACHGAIGVLHVGAAEPVDRSGVLYSQASPASHD